MPEKITIRTDSWHFRLVHLMDDSYRPKSLCSYFWRVVLNIASIPFIVAHGMIMLITVTPLSLAAAWSKSKYRKVCPLITLEGDLDEEMGF